MPAKHSALKHNIQRIRWHSRRGMLELDLILVPFAEQHFESLDIRIIVQQIRMRHGSATTHQH